jgi:hypothetical protein
LVDLMRSGRGVVHALRRIHAALPPGGLVVDSQPVSPEPPAEAADGGLGWLDMREWRETIDAVDERTAEAIGLGLFAIESEHTITVPDEFDSGAEFIEVVGAWRGTRIPRRSPRARRPRARRSACRRRSGCGSCGRSLGSRLDREARKCTLTVSVDLPT